MKNYTNILTYAALTAVMMLLSMGEAWAQILPPPGPPSGGTGVPLDPMSWVILGAGGVYAYKRYKNSRKKGDI